MILRHSFDDIMAMNKGFRTTFVNCLSGIKSPMLLGTQDELGSTNLTVLSSIVHVGANPPLIGMLFRPHTVPRHGLENILNIGCFTLNHISHQFYEEAHQCSARYPRNISEFDAVGLTPVYRNEFGAPYVHESRLSIGLSLQERLDIKANETVFIIGKIEWVYIDAQAVEADGHVLLDQIEGVGVVGLDAYQRVNPLSQLPYAKAPPE